jgi:hypothetical protein
MLVQISQPDATRPHAKKKTRGHTCRSDNPEQYPLPLTHVSRSNVVNETPSSADASTLHPADETLVIV